MVQGVSHVVVDQIMAVLERVWRRRWLAVAVSWTVALLAVAVIPFVPQRYEAKALIYVDTQSVLKPLMAGLAYQPDMEQQVRMLARTVISRPNLEAMLDRGDLSLGGPVPAASSPAREALLTQLTQRITLTAGESGLYTISYRDAVPERAQRLVEATLDLFVNSSSSDTKRDSENAKKFIADQIASYEAKLVEAEGRLKEFRVRNVGVLGLSNQDYIARTTELGNEIAKLESDLRAAERSRDAYRRELAGEDLVPAVDLTEVEAAIGAAQKQLDDLLRRFTDSHPDVVAARQVLARLEARKRQQMSGAGQTGASKLQAAAATSPVYQKLRVSLAEAEAQVAGLRSRVAAERSRLEQLRSVAGKVPQVDAELAQLNRDYDVIRKNYEQLVARRESASIGVKLDESTRLADFRVVEPPRVDDKPVFPGHLSLSLMAVAGSLLLGLLAPLVADQLHPTFEDVRTLREFTGRPVVGTVVRSPGTAALSGGRVSMAGFTLSVVTLLLFNAAWVAWIFVQRPS